MKNTGVAISATKASEDVSQVVSRPLRCQPYFCFFETMHSSADLDVFYGSEKMCISHSE